MVERRFPKSTDKGSNPFSPEKKEGMWRSAREVYGISLLS